MAIATAIVASVAAGLIVLWLQGKTVRPEIKGASASLLGVWLLLQLATEAGALHWGQATEQDAAATVQPADGTAGEPLPESNSAQIHRADEQLNIIVFNATRTNSLYPRIDPEFYWAVNQLKRVLNDCSIDAREYWENRRYRQRTEVHFHGARAESAAREIAELLPGHQDVESLERSRLWGMHPDRDIVILLGGDASYIEGMLSQQPDTRPCPRLSGQLGTG